MTSERLAARLRKHVNLGRHLAELGRLLGRTVSPDELLPFEETQAIREKSILISRPGKWRTEIAFAEKSGQRFADFIARLHELNNGGVYLWLEYTNDCGLLRPIPLTAIDWGFPYELNTNGILSMVTEDLKDKLIVDFFEDAGERRVEIEAAGEQWGQARY